MLRDKTAGFDRKSLTRETVRIWSAQVIHQTPELL
jgi:hypothetical protein